MIKFGIATERIPGLYLVPSVMDDSHSLQWLIPVPAFSDYVVLIVYEGGLPTVCVHNNVQNRLVRIDKGRANFSVEF
jgi:hypothetical protein